MNEIIMKVLVESFIKAVFDEIKSLLSDISDVSSDELKQYFNGYLKNYLKKKKDNYSKIKTLLRGNTPTDFYEVYYPLKISFDKEEHFTCEIEKIFKDYNSITLIGGAGSGKSTIVKHLFLSALERKKEIPILIELRQLNIEKKPFEILVKNTLKFNNLTVNERILERLLRKGKFIFFLDGYDELSSDLIEEVTIGISKFQNEYSANKFLLTSRPYSSAEGLPGFYNCTLNNLSFDNGDVEGFIQKQLGINTEISRRIIESVTENKEGYLSSFMKNPLLLSLYMLTFQYNADIPKQKHLFYRRVIDVLFSEHDSKSKMGYVREKKSGLSQFDFEEIMQIFSYLTYFNEVISFTKDKAIQIFKTIKEKTKTIEFNPSYLISDLKLAVSLWIEDDGLMSFSHRSIQEYYAALFISNLDSENKPMLYKKLVEKITDFGELNSIYNFMTLLEEMDTLYFYKHYKIILINEAIEKLDKEDDLYTGVIKYICSGVSYPSNFGGEKFYDNKLLPNMNNDLYHRLYLYPDLMPSLIQHIMCDNRVKKLKINEINKKYITSPGKYKFGYAEDREGIDISFVDNIPQNVKELILTKDFKSECKKFRRHLKDIKLKTEKYISDKHDNDLTLLEMI